MNEKKIEWVVRTAWEAKAPDGRIMEPIQSDNVCVSEKVAQHLAIDGIMHLSADGWSPEHSRKMIKKVIICREITETENEVIWEVEDE